MHATGAVAQKDPRRWKALALLGSIQFMLLLDATVVAVALPSMERDLGFSQEHLSWVLNGYVITAGSFLLLGGRLADILGRRLVFIGGVAAFGIGSVFCAMAWSPSILVAARFVQGLGEAFAGPAALGIIALLFRDPYERVRALTIWGAIAGLGSAAGSMVGGLITSFASWHWLFIINIPISIAAIIGALALVPRIEPITGQKLDIWGAVTASGALIGIIYGVLQAVEHPLTSPAVAVPFLVGLLLFGVMIWVEGHVEDPLIPRGFFSDQVRKAATVLAILAAASYAAYPFTLTLFAQNVAGYSPLDVGLMMLPFVACIGFGLWLGSRLLARRPLRQVVGLACALGAAGLLVTSFLTEHSRFLGVILVGMILFGLAIGLAMPTLTNGALHGTDRSNSSIASAVQTTAHQVGQALGLAIVAAAATAMTHRLIDAGWTEPAADTGGYVLGLRLAALACAAAVVVAFTVLPNVRLTAGHGDDAPEGDLQREAGQ